MSEARQHPFIDNPSELINSELLQEWDTAEAWNIYRAASDTTVQDTIALLSTCPHAATKELMLDGQLGMIEELYGIPSENSQYVFDLSRRLRQERLNNGKT